MELLSVIRRWRLRDGMAIREIARRTGLSRTTIRKYLRSGVTDPKYPRRKVRTKLDEFEQVLGSWLKREAGRGRKRRRNLRQMYDDLVELGYQGSYDRVAAYARIWRAEQYERDKTSGRGTFVPLTFAPGEAFQFDWSEDRAHIGGASTKLQVAQFKLSYSRAFILRAYLMQTHEMLFDAHNHALAALGGAPQRGIYDNMKTAIDKVGRGKAREVNARFQAMVSHFLFEPAFCNPASGWEKGQIEKNVRDARGRIWQKAPRFATLAELNSWLEARCIALWSELEHPEFAGRSIAEVWAEEQPELMRMPPRFDGFIEHTKRVSPTCLVVFERCRYSVPASFANRPVSLRVYADKIVIAAEGRVLAEQLSALRDTYTRLAIRAPVSGTVVDIAVHTIGGVVQPGDRLMDIVPEGDDLIVEARIPPQHIDRVHVGLPADVHFDAYVSRAERPVISGSVTVVSADVLTDARTDNQYYALQVTVPADEMEKLGRLQLQPGMQATVMIKTGERSLLVYLLRPLMRRFTTALSEH